jgi:hypothetical protein
MDLFAMNFDDFELQPDISRIFPCGRENAVTLGCAEIRGSGGLCAPIGLHPFRGDDGMIGSLL